MLPLKICKILTAGFFLTLTLSACNGFFEKDNTPPPKPLISFTPVVFPKTIWSTGVGLSTSDGYLKMNPAVTDKSIFTAATTGSVISTNKCNGHRNWRVLLEKGLTSGPGAADGIVVVAHENGDIVALREADGRPLWKNNIASSVIANPAIQNGLVVVKSIDGYVRALSQKTGQMVWSYQQTEPTLLLRGASRPIIHQQSVLAGFANGTLAKLNLESGNLRWSKEIAIPTGGFAIQRMIDIDADPLLFGQELYAATYQGKVAKVNWYTGTIQWSHDLSSYTGMTTNGQTLFITDARSRVWAFNAQTGEVKWRTTVLLDRNITAPALMNGFIVVGDKEGYLHWLNTENGQLAGRLRVGWPIIANPIVDQGVLYILTKNGKLSAYHL